MNRADGEVLRMLTSMWHDSSGDRDYLTRAGTYTYHEIVNTSQVHLAISEIFK